MSVPVVMPALGESATEGTITRWLRAPGDHVEKGQPLVEVATDKVDTEIESPATGILVSIDVPQDTTVGVGTQIATIADALEGPEVATPTVPAEAEVPRPYTTPAVRALVRLHGTDLSTIRGTGRGGRVTLRDARSTIAPAAPALPPSTPEPTVPAAPSRPAPIASPTPQPSIAQLPGRTEPLTRLRTTIANRMVDSLKISAQLTTVVEVDLTAIATLRQRHNAQRSSQSPKLSFLPFIARATCDTLNAHPVVNASIDLAAGTVTYHDAVHLGIAVDTERGLLVPVIPHAEDLTVTGLARRINDVAGRTRDSAITADELGGGTFTITNTGSRGALFDTPIINQPQAAILGFGAVVKRPIVVTSNDGEDAIAIRSMAYLALTYDHRLVDGADAARFLSALKTRLEEAAFAHDLTT